MIMVRSSSALILLLFAATRNVCSSAWIGCQSSKAGSFGYHRIHRIAHPPFLAPSNSLGPSLGRGMLLHHGNHPEIDDDQGQTPKLRTIHSLHGSARRSWLQQALLSAAGGLGPVLWWTTPTEMVSAASDGPDDESFASIAARAGQMSRTAGRRSSPPQTTARSTDKTMYDFALPVQGIDTALGDLIQQSKADDSNNSDLRVKAIVVVNIKQDDPVARRAIPELMSLAGRYARFPSADLAIIGCPTDQGYYEPDTSTLIRLKLASEYGYGLNPALLLTDKVNLLGTGAHPFWRWLQSQCRTPAGLGRVEGNFEKFLLDGRTGLPLRRYPRKYAPSNMSDDIEAVIAGRPLPPPKANWQEAWRQATAEADRDTYRFEKGLNVFDQ